jgi:hypothetical protein
MHGENKKCIHIENIKRINHVRWENDIKIKLRETDCEYICAGLSCLGT